MMNRRQFLIGAALGALLGSAGLAISLGYAALFGVQVAAVGLRLSPDDLPTDLRAILMLLGALGVAVWLAAGLGIAWYSVRRARPAAQKTSPPMWYTGAPSIPHFTPPIPPPEAAYSKLSHQAFPLSDEHTQGETPAHLERTQVPSMPPLLSYESLFPTEQTAQLPPMPSAAEDAPDAAPTAPPLQDA
jgi:hypothetical protein